MRASSHRCYTLSRCILARIIALGFPEGPFSNVEASPGSILRWHRQSWARKDQGGFMSISTKSQGPVENYLLAALPDEVLARLLPHLKQVSFALGGVV